MTANNVANMATTGFRAEGLVFAEMVKAMPVEGGSVSMTDARVRYTDYLQGELAKTGGSLDLGIQGEGFFQIESPDGLRLTRGGAFLSNAANELVTSQGHRVLDQGGAPIFIPPDASVISVSEDGTVGADGRPVAQVGVVTVEDKSSLIREGNTYFRADGDIVPVENPSIFQGFLEQSNVNPVASISRLVELQRAYEMGQSLMDSEDQRIRNVIRTLGGRG